MRKMLMKLAGDVKTFFFVILAKQASICSHFQLSLLFASKAMRSTFLSNPQILHLAVNVCQGHNHKLFFNIVNDREREKKKLNNNDTGNEKLPASKPVPTINI
jgi:hypothetical protein